MHNCSVNQLQVPLPVLCDVLTKVLSLFHTCHNSMFETTVTSKTFDSIAHSRPGTTAEHGRCQCRNQNDAPHLQEVLDNLVWYDVANIVSIGQLGEGHSSHLCLLQISKGWPTTVPCCAP